MFTLWYVANIVVVVVVIVVLDVGVVQLSGFHVVFVVVFVDVVGNGLWMLRVLSQTLLLPTYEIEEI